LGEKLGGLRRIVTSSGKTRMEGKDLDGAKRIVWVDLEMTGLEN